MSYELELAVWFLGGAAVGCVIVNIVLYLLIVKYDII